VASKVAPVASVEAVVGEAAVSAASPCQRGFGVTAGDDIGLGLKST
jgi:hypothetical protein